MRRFTFLAAATAVAMSMSAGGAHASVVDPHTASCTASGLLGLNLPVGGTNGPSCTTAVVACTDPCTIAGSITVSAGARIGQVGGVLSALSTDGTVNAGVTSCATSGPSCTGTYGGGAAFPATSYRGLCGWGYPSLINLFVTVTCTITAETRT